MDRCSRPGPEPTTLEAVGNQWHYALVVVQAAEEEEDVHYHYLQTQFGEDQCMQLRVIVVTDPQTNKHSHKPTNQQDRLKHTVPLSLACSVTTEFNPNINTNETFA